MTAALFFLGLALVVVGAAGANLAKSREVFLWGCGLAVVGFVLSLTAGLFGADGIATGLGL